MVRDWTKRFNNFEVVAVPCFVRSRTIPTKISIFSFLRVLPEIILYRTRKILFFILVQKLKEKSLRPRSTVFQKKTSFVEPWRRHFEIKFFLKKLWSYFKECRIKALKKIVFHSLYSHKKILKIRLPFRALQWHYQVTKIIWFSSCLILLAPHHCR